MRQTILPDRYFEDWAVGDEFESAPLDVTEADIIDFARRFDPQPFHLDREAASRSPFGQLVASGWHSAAIMMKLVVESGVMRATGTLGIAVDELRWPRALRPGDTVRLRGRVLEKLDSSKAYRGKMRVLLELRNQDGDLVMSEIPTLLVGRRPE